MNILKKSLSVAFVLVFVFQVTLFSFPSFADPSTGTGPSGEDAKIVDFFRYLFGTGSPDFSDTSLKIQNNVLAPNFVQTGNIQDGGVQGVDIADRTITFSKLIGCVSANQVLKWDGSAWSCISTDSFGIQSVNVNTTSGYITGDGTENIGSGQGPLSIDTTKIQRRISQSCNSNEFVSGVNEDGTVICTTFSEGDGNTTNEIQGVMTGKGLQKDPSTNDLGIKDCSLNGQFLTYNSATGSWDCSNQKSDLWMESGGNVYITSGNVGIGTVSPSYKLDVSGTVRATAFIGDGSGLTGVITTETDPTVQSFAKSSIPTTCTASQIPKWNGLSWSCVNISGSGIETDPTVNTLGKATLACASGQIAKYNGTTWSCATDNQGITVETDPNVNALGKANFSCTTGQVVKWNGVSWECATDNQGVTSETDPTVKTFAKTVLPTCSTGYVLKSDGTTLACVADNDTDTKLTDGEISGMGYIKTESDPEITAKNLDKITVTPDGKLGVGTMIPLEKLEVVGGVKVGNTTGSNAGTIRWTGSDFEGYEGSNWKSLTKGAECNTVSGGFSTPTASISCNNGTISAVAVEWQSDPGKYYNPLGLETNLASTQASLACLGGDQCQLHALCCTAVAASSQTLGGLSCQNNEVPVYENGSWGCGANGSGGSGGLSGYEIVQVDKAAGDPNGWMWATCPTGKVVIGGSCTTGSGSTVTNTSISGNNYGCYKHTTSTNFQLKAVCALQATATPEWATSGTNTYFTNTGNVGIGTTSPTFKLDVQGGRTMLSGNNEVFSLGLRYASNTQPYYIGATNSTTSADLVFSQQGGAERMRITESGNVGIGTTSPTQRLDLGGGNISMGYEQVTNSCTGTSCSVVTVTCPSGKYVTGGGCVLDNTTRSLFRNYPSGLNSWTCHSQQNLENAGAIIRAYAICANIR